MTEKHGHVPLCLPASWLRYCRVGASPYLCREPAVMVSGTTSALLLWGSELLSPRGQHSARVHWLTWKYPMQPFILLLLAGLNHWRGCMCRGMSGREGSLMKNSSCLLFFTKKAQSPCSKCLSVQQFQPRWQHSQCRAPREWAEPSVPLPDQQSQQSSCIPHPKGG